MIDLIMLNERALVKKSPEALSVLNYYLSYTTSSCKKDIRKSRIEKRTVLEWNIEEHTHLIDDGSPFYTITRGLAELLPEDEFNKIYEISNDLDIPNDLSDYYITNCLGGGIELREDQIAPVRESLYNKRGINQLATGAGKSIIICAIIKILITFNPNIRLLLILPYEHLQQSFSEYFDMFGISYELASDMDGSKNVTISSAISILNRSNYLSSYNGVFYDECQHLQSDTWNQVSMNLVNAEIALGFSAKIIEPKNISNPNIKKLSPPEAFAIGATGRVLTYIPASYYIEMGILATPIMISISNYLSLDLLEESDWHTSVNLGLMSRDRSELVGKVTDIFARNGRRVLVLVSTHSQSFMIAEDILKCNQDLLVGVSHGGNKGYIYKYSDQEGITWSKISGKELIDKFKTRKINILIGTSHMDEGADLPDLDVCVLAGAGKNSRRVIQKVGRSLRVSKTGIYAYLIDFEDNNSKILNRHYKERMKTYISDIGISVDRLYKGLSLEQVEETFKRLEGIS